MKQAVESAATFAKSVLEPERVMDLRLERVGGFPAAGTSRLQKVLRIEGIWHGPLNEDPGNGRRVMQDALGLINQHQSRGVLVDTNLLVLYLVGKVNRNRIPNFKRTRT